MRARMGLTAHARALADDHHDHVGGPGGGDRGSHGVGEVGVVGAFERAASVEHQVCFGSRYARMPASTVSTSEAWPAVTQVPSRSERLSASGPIRATLAPPGRRGSDSALVLQQDDRLRASSSARSRCSSVSTCRSCRSSALPRVVEEAQVELETEHAAHGGVDHLDRHRPSSTNSAKYVVYAAAVEIHVDTRQDAQSHGVLEVAGHSVLHQFADGVEVAHHRPGEPPLLPQHRAQQEGVAGARHAADLVERAHGRIGPGVERRLERRQVDVAQRALRDVDRVVVAAGFGGPVAGVVLRDRRRCGNAVGRSGVWKPRTCAWAIALPRKGSSPAPSAMRPQRGSRAMSTMGAKNQLMPAVDASTAADAGGPLHQVGVPGAGRRRAGWGTRCGSRASTSWLTSSGMPSRLSSTAMRCSRSLMRGSAELMPADVPAADPLLDGGAELERDLVGQSLLVGQLALPPDLHPVDRGEGVLEHQLTHLLGESHLAQQFVDVPSHRPPSRAAVPPRARSSLSQWCGGRRGTPRWAGPPDCRSKGDGRIDRHFACARSPPKSAHPA